MACRSINTGVKNIRCSIKQFIKQCLKFFRLYTEFTKRLNPNTPTIHLTLSKNP
ncbi:hypothetical protein SAMN04488109_0308 [Chryseolinea serpens]|uniref:Uncharacterized protein n=1 Tax=Chryseolinea serpens TaxID=947013 RepID=A0A1M5JVD2_9BACT|nr:hypothetical protein SAMN04488109_0308 [Chryseolinea serpens]